VQLQTPMTYIHTYIHIPTCPLAQRHLKDQLAAELKRAGVLESTLQSAWRSLATLKKEVTKSERERGREGWRERANGAQYVHVCVSAISIWNSR